MRIFAVAGVTSTVPWKDLDFDGIGDGPGPGGIGGTGPGVGGTGWPGPAIGVGAGRVFSS